MADENKNLEEKKHKLMDLPYDYDAIEPLIDEETMRVHHDKHHQAYVDNLNTALSKHPELFDEELENLLMDLKKVPEDIRTAVRNHGGGVWNHNLFWMILKKDVVMPKEIGDALIEAFSDFEVFKDEFKKAALGQFGSGWAWLVLDGKDLKILKLPNQDTPMELGMFPLLTIDVWEHAYYLKYQNRRAEYVDNFFNCINWDEVNRRFLEGKNKIV
jgi:superoxide dismutase, Fe-Mn family